MSVFRELFNELPDALFAALKGIGEQAIVTAQQRTFTHGPPSRSSMIRNREELFKQMFGWKRCLIARSPHDRALEFHVTRSCGHSHHFQIDETKLETMREGEWAKALVVQLEAKDDTTRRCYCLERR